MTTTCTCAKPVPVERDPLKGAEETFCASSGQPQALRLTAR
jgi:hypothetical protein